MRSCCEGRALGDGWLSRGGRTGGFGGKGEWDGREKVETSKATLKRGGGKAVWKIGYGYWW
jgi:hypothetical protein